jgi:hypothetical protein
MKKKIGIVEILPYEARTRLVNAAKTENTTRDPHARVRAINAAEAWAKANHPSYFKKEKETVNVN